MIARRFGQTRIAILASVVTGSLFTTATIMLLPSAPDVLAAKHRAGLFVPQPEVTPRLTSHRQPPTPAMLAARFSRNQPMSAAELRQLLSFSIPTAEAERLSSIVDRIDGRVAVSTAQISWDLLASGRAIVAKEFLELRPDRGSPQLWRLRFELHRKTNDISFARTLVRSAATTPGMAGPKDLIEAAFALNMPEWLVTALERGSVPRLDGDLFAALVQRAVRSGRYDLIPRIDRIGTADWRRQDPWLAMHLAQRSGNIRAALFYADLLPSSREEARRSIIMASGDRVAIRALLLDEAEAANDDKGAVAQQLLEAGWREDAMEVLRRACVDRTPDDPQTARLLYLMGPRPDSAGLKWLRARAASDDQWRKIYVERERPATALEFIEGLPQANRTELLIERLSLASAARDGAAAVRALRTILDGRTLTATQWSAVTAQLPGKLDRALFLAVQRARIAAGAGLPSDRLDLAWEAWNRRDVQQAFEQLNVHLQLYPRDLAALSLMGDVERRRNGNKAARPWLERALANAQPYSLERAELLDKLGRTREAMALIEALRMGSPRDDHIASLYARLLVTAGNPARARKVLQE